MPFLWIESEKKGEFPFLKPSTNTGGHIVTGHFTHERKDEIGNRQGKRRAKRFAKDKKREMSDPSSDLAKHSCRKMVENKAANTCPRMKSEKGVKKISAFPLNAMGKGGRSGYKIQASDQ